MIMPTVGNMTPMATITLPVFLAHGSKVTMYHNGTYHKGFLLHLPASTYRFSVWHQISSKPKEWGLNLGDFLSDWLSLYQHHHLIPSWIIPPTLTPTSDTPTHLTHPTLLLKPLPHTHSTASLATASPIVMAPINECVGTANHISTQSLQHPCPTSLQKALHPNFLDQTIWLASYEEEKHALQDIGIYKVITLDRYRELQK
jgi:hypothetical protein